MHQVMNAIWRWAIFIYLAFWIRIQDLRGFCVKRERNGLGCRLVALLKSLSTSWRKIWRVSSEYLKSTNLMNRKLKIRQDIFTDNFFSELLRIGGAFKAARHRRCLLSTRVHHLPSLLSAFLRTPSPSLRRPFLRLSLTTRRHTLVARSMDRGPYRRLRLSVWWPHPTRIRLYLT